VSHAATGGRQFPGTGPRRGARVLMVEDDAALRDLYGTMLYQAGYEVECVATGEEAVSRCRRRPPPDALVVDIQLEDTDGLSVMRRVLEIHPGLPVVIHSAFPAYKGDFAAWCADAYVVKSTDCTRLARCLDQVLEQRQAGAENPR
jgi:DNA-binding NtrC family response regulator